MNKLQMIILTIMCLEAFHAGAQDYVRKNVRPDFFIPEKEFDNQEKLPVFPALENGTIKATDQGVMIKTTNSNEAVKTPAHQENEVRPRMRIQDLRMKPMQTSSETIVDEQADKQIAETKMPASKMQKYTPEDGLGNDLNNDASYIAKEKAYDEDLQAMAATKKMPHNPQLEADLKKMNSDEAFTVE